MRIRLLTGICCLLFVCPAQYGSGAAADNTTISANAPNMVYVDISTLKPIATSANVIRGAVYADVSKSAAERALDLIRRLSFEEKLSLTGGWNRFMVPGVERLGIRPISMADASQGVRLQTALVKSRSVSFPGMLSLASTWNIELAREFGHSIGEECRALGVDILLGPGVNIQRLSVGGRNFEYMGEDPWLSSCIAQSYVVGLQKEGIIAVPKHFVGNDQDFCRHIASSNIDERTLREIYLLPWEKMIVESGCKGIMTGNNLVNGISCPMNKPLITGILRQEFGFTGLAVTDWQNTGYYPDLQHLVMPSGETLLMPDNQVFRRYIEGQVAISKERKDEIEIMLEKMIFPTIYTLFNTGVYDRDFNNPSYFDTFDNHKGLATQCAEQAIVMLKNDKAILPITTSKTILLMGQDELHSGTGSGFVAGYDHVSYEKGLRAVYGGNLVCEVKPDAKTISRADVVLFRVNKAAGEGRDIPFDEPQVDLQELRRVAKLNKNVIVLINACNVMPMDWINDVKGVLWCYFLGQQRGTALANVVCGKVSPSGKLPFTIERSFADSPAPDFNHIGGSPYWKGNNQYKSYWLGENSNVVEDFSNFIKPGQIIDVPYSEGVFIGYRWYDKKSIPVVFPFGYGLSYTKFEYSDIVCDGKPDTNGVINISVKVRNAGKIDADEIVQLYVTDKISTVERPQKELKAFARVSVMAGETKRVVMRLNPRSFAFWDINTHDWVVESGEFEIKVGGSSANLPLRASIVL